MNILEQYIQGKKGNPAECEDGLVVRDTLIAAVDGATAKGTKTFDGMASGAFARAILCNTLSQPEIEKFSAQELFSLLSQRLDEETKKHYSELEFHERPRISAVIYNDLYKEVWSYGDCQCIINGELYNHEKSIDVLFSETRAFYIEHALLSGHTIEDLLQNDIARKMILENLPKQFDFENKNIPFGYSVINGFPINPDMIVRHKVKDGDEIVLASDGYPLLKGTLKESEEHLEYVLKNDPLCFRIYKTTKGMSKGNLSFDDRCYCRFTV